MEMPAAARRRRRRRRWRAAMLWLLTAVTTAALLLVAGFVKEISKAPAVAQPAALTATAHDTRHATASPSPSASAQVRDASSGLSYQLLSSPWQRGCPGVLDTPMFSWTAGEHAVAGRVSVGGTTIDWHGNACSGQLGQQFAYSGPADLEPVTIGLADAVEPAYYSGLRHHRTIESSSAMQVSWHPAWVVTFLMTYPDAAAEGLAWTSEAGAVVVVDRGAGQAPAVFYASVPSNLGTSDVAALVSSLRLSPG
ncbi:MAG TPA: hypothetical protein VK280_07645 [Streptosporangiaceae bacterium]|nr:hypothetical protein [Streptosporangiaceae bacterium]